MRGHNRLDASRLRLASLAVLVTLAILEAGSYLVILVSQYTMAEPIRRKSAIFSEQSRQMRRIAESAVAQIQLDSVLGWRYRAGFRGPTDTLNSDGLRSAREYAPVAGDSVLRVAVFGDSFVYGNEVGNDSAWTSLVERRDPRLEILNYGVGGYGADQAYLRFLLEGRALAPDVAVLSFSLDDLHRTVNVYRRFISTRELPLFKPRFRLDGAGQLILVPNPAPTVGAYLRFAEQPSAVLELASNDEWFEPAVYSNPVFDYSATIRIISYFGSRFHRRFLHRARIGRSMNPTMDAFRIQMAIFENFARSADSMNIHPLILFLPDRLSVARASKGERTLYAELVRAVHARRLSYLDAIEAFPAGPHDSVSTWFAAGGHYSGRGNGVVATWLGTRVRRLAVATAPVERQ